MRRVVRGAEVLRGDRTERLDLWIEDGRIAGFENPGWKDAEAIDAKGHLAIPGLVNSHTHSQSALLQGTVRSEPLDLFVMRAIARGQPRSSRSAYVSACLHAIAMLKHGVTAHVDHLRDGLLPSDECVDTVFEAYRDAGIRAAVAPMYEDRVYLDSLPIDAQALPAELRERLRSARRPPAREYFALMERLLPRWRGKHGRLDVLLGVDGPQRCTPELLEMTGHFAKSHGIGLHTHLLEAKTQHLMAPAGEGGSFVRYLDRFGLINEKSSLAHFVWCTDEDIALAAERGVSVVHNPVSNLMYGSGILPAARVLRAGVHLALGTDGQSSSPASVLEAAKMATLLSRVHDVDPSRWLGPADAFRMASAGGARVLGLGGKLGVLEPGARADIALIETSGPAWQPRGELYQHLVMFETGRNVRMVLVEGEVVVRDGRCVTLNEEDLLAEAQEIATRLDAAVQPALARIGEDLPHLEKLLLQALARPSGINRFAS